MDEGVAVLRIPDPVSIRNNLLENREGTQANNNVEPQVIVGKATLQAQCYKDPPFRMRWDEYVYPPTPPQLLVSI